MAYTLDIALNLGAGETGLTLTAQLVDTAGVAVGSPVATGFVEIGAGNYLWHYASFPDNFRGGVIFSAGATVKGFVAVNPEDIVQDVTSGTATAYVSLAELRAEISDSPTTMDTNDDLKLTAAALAASRAIDNECGRFFYASSSASARYYTAEYGDYLRVDDICASIGGLASLVVKTDEDGDRTYETTWTINTDFDLEPYNAYSDAKCWTVLRVAPSGRYSFPTLRKGVELTAKWGWAAVPADIKTAGKIEAVRLYKRRDAPFGQTGSPEVGVMNLPALDPDVKRLIAPYRKMGLGGI